MRPILDAAAFVLFQIIGTSALTLPNIWALEANKIYFYPIDGAECGVGTTMFYGIVTPANMTTASRKNFWMENMGGAICFNEGSCKDEEFSVWLDLVTVIFRYAKDGLEMKGATAQQFLDLLTIPNLGYDLDEFRLLKAAYFPNKGGPLEGQVGFYFPSCSGDAGLGNYKVDYNSDMTVRHVGGVGFRALLQAIKAKHSQLERMTLIGASGTAVSRVAWAPAVADMFPQAQILVVADSAMHVLPATKAFQFFWNDVQWSPNPNGNHTLAKIYDANTNSLPTFDWRRVSAISDMLLTYGGRIKVLYIGCVHDKVIVEDRSMLSRYAKLDMTATKESSTKEVEKETWEFLKRLRSDAPAGTAFSYITKGDCHHQTRNGFEVEPINKSDPSDLGVRKFTEAFLTDKSSGPQHRWCCGKMSQTAPPVDRGVVSAKDAGATPGHEEISSVDSTTPSLIALAFAFAAAWEAFTTEPFTSSHE